MARRTDGGVRFRPVGSSRHPRTPVRYSPGGTGCPAIEQAIDILEPIFIAGIVGEFKYS